MKNYLVGWVRQKLLTRYENYEKITYSHHPFAPY
jgi:hypothetical protein